MINKQYMYVITDMVSEEVCGVYTSIRKIIQEYKNSYEYYLERMKSEQEKKPMSFYHHVHTMDEDYLVQKIEINNFYGERSVLCMADYIFDKKENAYWEEQIAEWEFLQENREW